MALEVAFDVMIPTLANVEPWPTESTVITWVRLSKICSISSSQNLNDKMTNQYLLYMKQSETILSRLRLYTVPGSFS